LGGILTPKRTGTAVITAKTFDGSRETSCTIVVTSSNLALEKPATESNLSSKPPSDRPFPAHFAVDGIDNFINRWAANRTGSEDWLQIDLQNSYNIEGVKISWTAAYGKRFQLQISDDPADGNWTTVYTEADGRQGHQTIRFDETYNARYFRVYVASADRSYPQFGTSIQEIEIYGSE